MTISSLVFTGDSAPAPLKAKKFASSAFKATAHHYTSFQTSVPWKQTRACSVWGQEGGVESGVQTWLCRGPSPAGRQAARRLPHLSWHIPASFCCFQLLSEPPRRGLGQALSQNKKSWVCGSCVETHFPVTAKVNSCHRRSFDFRHCGREQSLEAQVTQSSFVLFLFFLVKFHELDGEVRTQASISICGVYCLENQVAPI